MAVLSNIIPSIRPIIFVLAPSRKLSLTRTTKRRLIRITIGRSKNLVVRESTIGNMQALTQRIRSTFAIFEPRTFPIAISVFPEILARIETISSGILVPTATIVSPIIACDIPNFFAIDTEPSTSAFPQKARRMSQKITETIESNIFMYEIKD